MKYKGEIDYPKVGDSIKLKRRSVTVEKLSAGKFKQGDLVLGYEKGVHVFIGLSSEGFPLLKRVYTDKLRPQKGTYSTCHISLCRPAEEFFEKQKEIHEKALSIIDEYLKG